MQRNLRTNVAGYQLTSPFRKVRLTTMARMPHTAPETGQNEPIASEKTQRLGGENLDRSLVRTARVVASFGLLGASIGGALPTIGLATTFGIEEVVGLIIGLVAGALLAARHVI